MDGYSQRISTVKRRVSQSALVKSASNIRMRNFQPNRSFTGNEVPKIRQKVLEINTVGDKERVPLCSDHENGESSASRSTASRDEQSGNFIEEPELCQNSDQSSVCHDD